MHTAIIAVEIPNDDVTDDKWRNFIGNVFSKTKDNPHVDQISLNVWQVNFQKAPEIFARLVGSADQLRLAYKILPFDAEPPWILAHPTAKAK